MQMSDNQGKDSFQEEKSSRLYNVLTFFAVLLVLCSAVLHYRANRLQGELEEIVSSAQSQSMLTQRMALLISQYRAMPSDDLLEDLRNTASAALINQETIESGFQEGLPPTLGDSTSTQETVSTLRDFFSKCMIYASAPQEKKGKELGQSLIAQSRDAAASWYALTTEFSTRVQKKIDTCTYISLSFYLLILCLLAFLYLKIFKPAMACITEQRKQLNRLASVDPLTGIYNRAMLFKVVRALIGTFKRQKQPMTALIIDIDNLRKTNETYGRAAGDALIKKVAVTMSAVLRSSDLIGRIGGDEFGVFLPTLDEQRSVLVVEKIRLAVEEMSFVVKESTVRVTVSIGVAEMKDYHDSPDDLLLSAGTALRRAKEDGGNRSFTFNLITADQP